MLKWIIGIIIVGVIFLLTVGLFADTAMRTEYHNQCMTALASKDNTLAIKTCECATDRFMTGMEGKEEKMGNWYAGGMTFDTLVTNHYGLAKVTDDFAMCSNQAIVNSNSALQR